jgi:hypothetical protein
MRRLASLLALLLAAPLLVGCAGSSEAGASVDEIPLSGELVVVVYSEKIQAAVPARGTVTPIGESSSVPFDTVRAVDEGKTLTLAPGRYTVAVTHRVLGSGSLQPVTGEQVLYVEPGARHEITVVVKDRQGDLGRLLPGLSHRPTTFKTPTTAVPPLPPEPSSG